MDEINIGSIVELRSGGPLMTVGRVYENEGRSFARCEWFDLENKPHHRSFAIEILDLVPANDVRLGG